MQNHSPHHRGVFIRHSGGHDAQGPAFLHGPDHAAAARIKAITGRAAAIHRRARGFRAGGILVVVMVVLILRRCS